MVATLCDLGWVPEAPDRWTDHRGGTWALEGAGADMKEGVRNAFTGSIHRRKASQHFAGSGLKEGARWGMNLKFSHDLRKKVTTGRKVPWQPYSKEHYGRGAA